MKIVVGAQYMVMNERSWATRARKDHNIMSRIIKNGAQTLISGIYFIKRNGVKTIRFPNNFTKKMTTASNSTASLN